MAMASPQKVRRGDADDASQMSEKLNGSEIRALTGLLHRAIAHGQAQMVIETYRGSRAPKDTYVPATLVVNECQQMTGGNMSDAAKRQRDGDCWIGSKMLRASCPMGPVPIFQFHFPQPVEIPM